MGDRGFCHLSNVGVGTENSEIICIGAGKECGGKEVEKGRGCTGAVRDPYSSMKEGGEGKVVSVG